MFLSVATWWIHNWSSSKGSNWPVQCWRVSGLLLPSFHTGGRSWSELSHCGHCGHLWLGLEPAEWPPGSGKSSSDWSDKAGVLCYVSCLLCARWLGFWEWTVIDFFLSLPFSLPASLPPSLPLSPSLPSPVSLSLLSSLSLFLLSSPLSPPLSLPLPLCPTPSLPPSLPSSPSPSCFIPGLIFLCLNSRWIFIGW